MLVQRISQAMTSAPPSVPSAPPSVPSELPASTAPTAAAPSAQRPLCAKRLRKETEDKKADDGEWVLVLSAGHEEPGYDVTYLVPADQMAPEAQRLLLLDPEERTDAETDQVLELEKQLYKYKFASAEGEQSKSLADFKVSQFIRTIAWA